MGVSKEYLAKVEVIVLVSWLMKDFAWVLLIAPLAWPMALAAITMQCHAMLIDWKTNSDAVNVHALAGLLWICGNAIWMTAELLWDTSSSFDPTTKHSIFPWHEGPLAGGNEQMYNTAVRYAQAVFMTGLLILAVFYVASGCFSSRSTASSTNNPQEDSEDAVAQPQELVWGFMTPEVYMMIYIGPWLMKDLFWSLELLWPGLFFSAVVFFLMCDCLRRFKEPTSAVELNWCFANTIWLIAELGIKTPELAPRIIAGGFLLVGVGLTSRVYQQAVPKDDDRDVRTMVEASEATALLGRPSSSSASAVRASGDSHN